MSQAAVITCYEKKLVCVVVAELHPDDYTQFLEAISQSNDFAQRHGISKQLFEDQLLDSDSKSQVEHILSRSNSGTAVYIVQDISFEEREESVVRAHTIREEI